MLWLTIARDNNNVLKLDIGSGFGSQRLFLWSLIYYNYLLR